jgi:hypothetical protein
MSPTSCQLLYPATTCKTYRIIEKESSVSDPYYHTGRIGGLFTVVLDHPGRRILFDLVHHLLPVVLMPQLCPFMFSLLALWKNSSYNATILSKT